jgi:prepilin-type N-terminal cleavage/methylation domain-containing protein
MRRYQTETGLTLIEVLTGLSIFAVIAAGLASSTVATLRANQLSKETTAAASLVQDAIERFRSIDPAANSELLTAGAHVDVNNPLTEMGLAGGYFTRVWVVTTNLPRTGMKTVRVYVSWNSHGDQHTVNGVAYLCATSTCA